MKNKLYMFLSVSVLAVLLLSSFSNGEKLDFTVDVTEISNNKIDVTVTIVSGEGDFEYALWDKEPWENGTEIDNSGKTNATVYTFTNLEKKAYVIVVTDNAGLRRVKQSQLP